MANAISRAHGAFESSYGQDPNWLYLRPAALMGMTGWAYVRIGDHHTATTYLKAAVDGTASRPRGKCRLANQVGRESHSGWRDCRGLPGADR